MGEEFWTARGVRQRCPLSLLFFNIWLADLEEELGRVKWGGVKIGGEKVYALAYAHDIVLVAEEEGEMRSMMERLEGYLERKKLELNAKKTKIMRFLKRRGRIRKMDWRWGSDIAKRCMEEMRERKRGKPARNGRKRGKDFTKRKGLR